MRETLKNQLVEMFSGESTYPVIGVDIEDPIPDDFDFEQELYSPDEFKVFVVGENLHEILRDLVDSKIFGDIAFHWEQYIPFLFQPSCNTVLTKLPCGLKKFEAKGNLDHFGDGEDFLNCLNDFMIIKAACEALEEVSFRGFLHRDEEDEDEPYARACDIELGLTIHENPAGFFKTYLKHFSFQPARMLITTCNGTLKDCLVVTEEEFQSSTGAQEYKLARRNGGCIEHKGYLFFGENTEKWPVGEDDEDED